MFMSKTGVWGAMTLLSSTTPVAKKPAKSCKKNRRKKMVKSSRKRNR